jgi:YHS domain-containing protein
MTDIFADRLLVSLVRSTALAAMVLVGSLSYVHAADDMAADNKAMSPVPAHEFEDSCAMGLADGQMVSTDCSVNWTDEDGKVYCFSSESSKSAFLKDPAGNIAKAKKFLEEQQAKADAGDKVFTDKDVNARVKEVLDERSKDGTFVFHDPKLDADLPLVFEEIKIVRGMEGYGWFANVIFHDKDEPKKQYALDFWFKPEGQNLTLMEIRVQKGPKRDGDGYFMITRLPVAWWWLPVQEHPGSIEGARAWQVMAAINDYIIENKDEDGNITIKDDKTGEDLKLQFVEMHRPVRHLKKEGDFFACTDFRKPGSKDEYYDIDFWVDEKTGKLKVNNVKVHKVPVLEDGIWTQVDRYTFEGMDFEETL